MAGRKIDKAKQEALKNNLKTYDGTLHQICNTTLRYTRSGACFFCSNKSRITNPKRQLIKEARENAIKNNKKTYIGNNCYKCDNKERYCYNYECINCCKEKRYFNSIKQRYNLSKENYEKQYNIQKGLCFICNEKETRFNGKLCVDHNHKSGVIRKLLCHKCNIGVGCMEDKTKEILNKFLKYIKWCWDETDN